MISTGDTILVTGGSGFLGSVVCNQLRELGFNNIVVPRRTEYNLVDQDVVVELYERFHPDVVLHLAAEVGGIGANRDNPGRYFFANILRSRSCVAGTNQRSAPSAANSRSFIMA